MMRQLLIVTTVFPPATEVGALRVAKLASWLAEFGWQSHVLTVAERSRSADRSTRSMPHVTFAADGPLIVESVDAPNPVAIAGRLLDRRSGAGRRGDGGVANSDPPTSRNFRGRLADAYVRMMIPDEYMFWTRRAVKAGLTLNSGHNFDAILASFPATSALLVGARISDLTGAPLVVDFRDPWNAYGPARNAGRLRNVIERRIRRVILKHAQAAIAVTGSMLEENLRGSPSPLSSRTVIPHGWDPREAAMFERVLPLSRSDGIFRVHYGGTVYPDSDISSVLRALRRSIQGLKHTRAQLRLIVQGVSSVDIEGEASHLGIGDIVEVRRPVERGEALHSLRQADLLLLARSLSDQHFISAKVWDYLTVGRPIFAVVSPRSPVARLVQETGVGVVARPGDVGDISRCLDGFLASFLDAELGSIEPDHEALARVSGPSVAAQLDRVLRGLVDDGVGSD